MKIDWGNAGLMAGPLRIQKGGNMLSENEHRLLEENLGNWKKVIGPAYTGYKNHVCRMVTFCMALHPCSEEEREKIIIAGSFHDIGIWTAHTLDYIPPSLPPAMDYLQSRNLGHWSKEIGLMISEHHKLRAYPDLQYPLVEVFRRGDLVDFSLGFFKFGLSRSYIDEVKARYPNAGFHKNLVRLATRWLIKHPLNPAPMMKW